MNVYLTVDTEMWPLNGGNWPITPLDQSQQCESEYLAYFLGDTENRHSGLPYQLEMLSTHQLKATFFVDPLFSFALGLPKLASVVEMIESGGQTVALHLHPEWLTDSRCKGLPGFRGPFLSAYSDEDQFRLINIGWARLVEAGAHPVRAFRAGSWGADIPTLRALRKAGFVVDSSLNAAFPHSIPSLQSRSDMHAPSLVEGLVEIPVTRFADGVSRFGRPLSLVGVSTAEMQSVLRQCYSTGINSATIVLHSNEFTRTERLWQRREPVPRRLVSRRFQRLCAFLQANRTQFTTRAVLEADTPFNDPRTTADMPRSSVHRTMARFIGQAISRWY